MRINGIFRYYSGISELHNWICESTDPTILTPIKFKFSFHKSGRFTNEPFHFVPHFETVLNEMKLGRHKFIGIGIFKCIHFISSLSKWKFHPIYSSKHEMHYKINGNCHMIVHWCSCSIMFPKNYTIFPKIGEKLILQIASYNLLPFHENFIKTMCVCVGLSVLVNVILLLRAFSIGTL